jgi:plastocyanin
MKNALTTLFALVITSSALAEVHIVVQPEGELTFVPAVVNAHPGDTIRWVHNSGTHDVVNGLPCNQFEEPIFQKMPLDAANPIAEWVIPPASFGEIPYFCSISSHCIQGMTGSIVVTPREGSTVHVVEQFGVSFVPETIEVAAGDTVVWEWNNGGHSVTSAELGTCVVDDTYFNLLLDSQHRSVIWEVPDTMPAILDYVCIFHCELGHVGQIIRVIPGDLNEDGSVDGSDLTLLLGCWGKGCGDITGDGATDGQDLSVLLGNWTVGG